MVKIAVLVAAVQPESIAHLAASQLAGWALQHQRELVFIDLAQSAIPLWDKYLVDELTQHLPKWQAIQQQLDSCDALLVLSPEWDEIILSNVYRLWAAASEQCLPGVVIRIESGSRGDYNARDLMMVNYRHNQQLLIVDQLNWSQQMIKDAQVNSYQMQRLAQSMLLLEQVGAHGWLRFAGQLAQPTGDRLI